ncbi:MAG: class II aldolase/adducin family protein [Acidimicrobiales bacterium]
MASGPVRPLRTEALASLVAHGRRMVRDGLATGAAGNLSVRVDDGIAITPSGVPYDALEVGDICVLDRDGEKVAGAGSPSSEAPMHLRIYAATDAVAIVHTHSPLAVAVSAVAEELPAVHYSILQLGASVRVARYATFGTDDLARSVLEALEGRRGALIQNHGGVTYGRSLAEAYDRAQLLEWLATVFWHASLLGTPRVLSAEELAEVGSEALRRQYPGLCPEG